MLSIIILNGRQVVFVAKIFLPCVFLERTIYDVEAYNHAPDNNHPLASNNGFIILP